MRHQANYDDLEKWAAESWHIFTMEIVDATNKSLAANMRGKYRVQSKRETIYEGENPFEAIQHYNAAR